MIGKPCLAFNAHRIFSLEEFLAMFPDFEVQEDIFLYPEPGSRERLSEIPLGQGIFYCVHLRKKHVLSAVLHESFRWRKGQHHTEWPCLIVDSRQWLRWSCV